MQEQIDGLKGRVGLLETAVNEIRLKQGTYVEKHNDLEKQFIEMRTDLHHVRNAVDDIKQGVNRAIWTFITAFMLAAIAWIINGGLAINH